MRVLIPCGLLLLSGCAPSATVPPNTAISPGPVVAEPTVAPVATAPAAAVTARPSNADTRAQFTPAERVWLDTALATFRQIESNSIRGSGTPLQRITAAHTTLRRAMARYRPMPVPPKFARADAYFRQAFAEDELTYRAMEAAVRAGDNA